MCGRFYLYTLAEEVAEAFGAEAHPDLRGDRPRYNIAPTQDILIVRSGWPDAPRREGWPDAPRREEDPAPPRKHHPLQLTTARWGLVPHWADSISIGATLINARAETARTKPAFRDAFARRRCLIPANGFYEWQAPAAAPTPTPPTKRPPKRPMRAQRPDGRLLAMAGLWESWRDPADPSIRLRSATILTTSANARLAPIHDRMPVFLEGTARTTWLDPRATPDQLQALLRPAADDLLAPTEITRRVNHTENDDPTLLTPAESADADTPDTGLLF